MIIVNIFVNFCILVFKGTSLLLNGLFSIIKFIFRVPFVILMYAAKGIVTLIKGIFIAIKIISSSSIFLIKTIISFIYKLIKLIIKYISKVLIFIFKFVITTIKYVFNKLKQLFLFVINFIKSFVLYVVKGLNILLMNLWKMILFILQKISNALLCFLKSIGKGILYIFKSIGYLFLYAMYGVKLIVINILVFIKFILIKIFNVVKILIHYVSIAFVFFGRRIFAFGEYIVKGCIYVGLMIYAFGSYVVKGIITLAITTFNVVIFIPKLIITSIIKFVSNFKATINKFIIIPIQNIADAIVKTYKDIVAKIIALPKNTKAAALEYYNNITWVKHLKNKRDMNRQVLLIDFNSKDAKRSDKKIVWQYSAKDDSGKFVKGIFEAFSKLDVHSFLMSEGYEVYDIKTSKSIEFFYGGRNSSNKRVNSKKMIFFLTQLSTYIRAGIPLTDSVRILSRQEKNKKMQRLYQSIIYELIMGENFSNALEKQGEAFPKLLVNMLKTSEMTGELAETLDDMSEYYSSTHMLRKQTLTSMMYPMVVFFFVIVVVVFIMIYVIPQFIEIYKNSEAELPAITVITISISSFLKQYIVFLILGLIAFIFLFRFLYRNVKFFKTIVQWIVMHIPVIKNVIIYNEITMFTKTFSALLKHNVFITDSMEILSKITNNEIYKMIVFDALTNIARGDNISASFKNHWAIPPLAYEMMVTGERTGQLPLMMGKVAIYFQEEQKNLVNQIKTLIEPIVIVILAGTVGIILLAVVVPMFSLYSDLSTGV